VADILSPTLTDFFNYNTEQEDLERSIRNDLVEAVVSEFFEKDFARFRGAGIELLENVSDDPLARILAGARIAEAIGLYNASVPPSRQVVTSQQFISITSRGDLNVEEAKNIPVAAWYIRIRYALLSQISSRGVNAFAELLIPSQGGV
jgi:hypothetical protein